MTDTSTLGSDPTPTATDPASTPAAPSEGAVEPQQQPTAVVEAPTASEPTEGTPEPVKVAGAPPEYEFTPPQGQTIDEGVLEAFSIKARELNLTNEGAQSFLDSVFPAMQKAAVENLEAQRTEWREQASKDSEFGGVAFDENVQIAKGALKRFASKGMVQLLNESGLSDHPEFVRCFLKVGKAISEDTLLTGGPPGAVEEDLNDPAVQERRMYPKT